MSWRHSMSLLSLAGLLAATTTPAIGQGFRPTPVCEAIVSGNLGRAMQLVEEGADPNAGYGCALIASASRGQLQMVELLLDRGANPNGVVSGDLTVVVGALVAAVHSREVDMVRLLLQRGANPREDFEAFEIVLNFGDIEMADLLLRHGANPNMRPSTTESVYAFTNLRPGHPPSGSTQMVEVSPRDLESDRIDDTARRFQCTLSGGNSLLHEATSRGAPGGDGRDRIAEMLIERGADVNARTLNGSTPLMNAAARSSPRVMRTSPWNTQDYAAVVAALLAAGADVSAKDRCGRSAEEYATSEEVKALLRR